MAEIPKTLVIDLIDTIPANTTKVVDALLLSEFSALEYMVSASNAPTKVKFLKLLVFKTDTEVETQVFARRGDSLQFEIDAFVSGLNSELRIKNNESFPLEVAMTRTIT